MNNQITKVLKFTEALFFFLSTILIPLSLYMIFMIVPSERVMGAVQRLFYYHVASAISCYVAFSIVFLASIGYLVSLNRLWAVINGAAGEVGFIFCTTPLATGMIWGKAAWNTWFRWEPRLVTCLLLWLIWFSFIILRSFGEKQRIDTQSAISGVLGSLTVPLVWLSVKLLPQVAQLHPQVIEQRGLKHYLFGAGLGLATITLIILTIFFLCIRVRIGLLESSVFSKRLS